MVEVTVRRTEAAGAPLGAIFASVFGYSAFDVEAKSVATVTSTTGYTLPTGSSETLELFPFTVDLTTWNSFVDAISPTTLELLVRRLQALHLVINTTSMDPGS